VRFVPTGNRGQSCYICHVCMYTCMLKTDMVKHTKRKIKCALYKLGSADSYETLMNRSISRRYMVCLTHPEMIFDKEQKKKDFVQYILDKKEDHHNAVTDQDYEVFCREVYPTTFLSPSEQTPPATERSSTPPATERSSTPCRLEIPLRESTTMSISQDQDQNTENPTLSKSLPYTEIAITEGVNKSDTTQDEYPCPDCGHVFTKMSYLITHHRKKRRCEYNQVKNQLSKAKDASSAESQVSTFGSVTNIYGDTYNIQNQNIQNIHNHVQAVQKIELNDFLKDHYSCDHITEEDISKKDFYVFKNFLEILARNDVNKNIFIHDRDLVFYTKDDLRKTTKEYGCFLLLQKMQNSIEHICRNMDGGEHIKRYYNILLKKYKNDTWHREYDADHKIFVPPIMSGSWMRDSHICDMASVLNQNSTQTKGILHQKGLDHNVIETHDFKFDGYISSRNRLRPLKEEA
jgi:hypothetical protein